MDKLQYYKTRRWASGILKWIYLMSGAVLVLVLIYIFYGLGSGYSSKVYSVAAPYRLAYQLRIIHNLKVALTIFTLSSFTFSISLLIYYFGDPTILWILGFYGIFCYFALPFCKDQMYWKLAPEVQRFTYSLAQSFQIAGIVPIIMVFSIFAYFQLQKLRSGIRLAEKEVYRPTLAKAKKKEKRSLLLSKCWEMPYCHEFIKPGCVALKRQRSCWKLKRGCYCDEEIILKMLRSGKITRETLALEFGTDTAAVTTKRTITCSRCFIYLEHQRQKHRIASPAVFVFSLLLIWLLFPFFHWLYAQGALLLGKLASLLTFAPTPTGRPQPTSITQEFLASGLEWVIIGVIALLIITYSQKLTDYLIYEAKI